MIWWLKPPDHLQRRTVADWTKTIFHQNPLQRRSPFPSQWLCQQTELQNMGCWKSKSNCRNTNASTKSDYGGNECTQQCTKSCLTLHFRGQDWKIMKCGFNMPHSSRNNALLQEKFPGRIISRNSEVRRPLRSCDLTPLDFFLWGHLKTKVYVNRPTTIQQLKD